MKKPATIAELIKESGSYVFAARIPATLIINLLTFIWLLEKVILRIRNLCTRLLQISKLKNVNFIMLIRIVLLTLRRGIIKIVTLYCTKCDSDFAYQDGIQVKS